MAVGEVFVLEDTGALTNSSHSTEADVALSGTPTLQQGDWSGQFSSNELNIPNAGLFLLGYSAFTRSSGTQRSGALSAFSLNTGGGHATQGIEATGKWAYNRVTGGADEADHHMAWMASLASGDDVKVRQGVQLNASDRVGDYNRTAGDPRGIWAVHLPDNDYLFATISAADAGSGKYQNTPRPINLGTPSALSSGSWKQVTWDSTPDSSGSSITRSAGVITLAANSKFLVDLHLQFSHNSDRTSALVMLEKDGSPYCYVTCYLRGASYNEGSTAVMTVPVITGGSTETLEVHFVDQCEDAGFDIDVEDASIRVINLTDADMCILAKTDADISNIDNTWRDALFPTADEIIDDTSFDHDGTNTNRINNNAGETITILAGSTLCWDRSVATNGTRTTPGHRLAKTGSGLDYAIWSEYSRGQQSADDQFVAGSSFCAPMELGTSDYVTFQYQDTSQQGGSDALVLNATDGAAVIAWAIRLDDLGADGSVAVEVPVATGLTATGYAPSVSLGPLDVTPAQETLSIATFAPTAGIDVNVEVPVASLTQGTFAPSISLGPIDVTPPVKTLTATGYAPGVGLGPLSVEAPVKTLSYSTFAPEISISVLVVPPVRTLSTATFAPDVDNPFAVTVPVKALSEATFVPTVDVAADVSVTVPVKTLTATGYAPTVDAGADLDIEVPVKTLTVAGYAPSVDNPVTITVPVGNVSFSTYAPSVDNPVAIEVPVRDSLTYAGYAPTAAITEPSITITPPVANLYVSLYAPTYRISKISGDVQPDEKPYEYQKDFLDMEPIVKADPIFEMRQRQKADMLSNQMIQEEVAQVNETVTAAGETFEKEAKETFERKLPMRRRGVEMSTRQQISRDKEATRQKGINDTRLANLAKARKAKKRKGKKK